MQKSSENRYKATISIDVELYNRFEELAAPKGVKFSTWINAKMKEFIEEEEYLEEYRRNRKSIR